MINEYLTVKKIAKEQTKQGKKHKKSNIRIYFYKEKNARVTLMCSILIFSPSSEQYHTVNFTSLRVFRMIKNHLIFQEVKP